MRILLAAIAPILALGITSSANAQNALVESDTDFFVQTSGGVPAYCGFEFTLIYRDQMYRRGELASITGTLGWGEVKGNIGLMLKIVGRDISNAGKPDMSLQPFPVANGFVLVDGKPILPTKSFPVRSPHHSARPTSFRPQETSTSQWPPEGLA